MLAIFTFPMRTTFAALTVALSIVASALASPPIVRIATTDLGTSFTLNDHARTPSEIQDWMRGAVRENAEGTIVLVQTDDRTSFKVVMDTLKLLRDAGIKRFSVSSFIELGGGLEVQESLSGTTADIHSKLYRPPVSAVSAVLSEGAQLTRPDCEAIGKLISPGMSRADVENILKPYKPIVVYGGGQGGPQATQYWLNVRFQIVIWFDLVRNGAEPINDATVRKPNDRVSKEPLTISTPLFPGTEEEFERAKDAVK